MSGPFRTQQTPTGLAARLLGRRARGGAAAAIEALFASSPAVANVSPEQISGVLAEYEISLDRLQGPCRDIYRRYFEFCLVDRALSDAELGDLAHLRDLLSIEDATAAAVHSEVGYAVYGTAIDEALRDSRMDDDERDFLEKLRTALGLEVAEAARALEEGQLRARQRYMADHLSPGALFATSEDQALEVQGNAQESLQAAVTDALAKGETVLPDLIRAEITSIHIDVDAGGVSGWNVTLRGKPGPKTE